MDIAVKNMVCDRCISSVNRILASLGIDGGEVVLGHITLPTAPEATTMARLSEMLEAEGFEIVRDPGIATVERIKALLVDAVTHDMPIKLAELLGSRIGSDYKALSQLFSRLEGRSIETYANMLRLERVKELLAYGELSVKEIAFLTGFSSTAHLSRRFRELTGMTPMDYRRLNPPRTKLDQI